MPRKPKETLVLSIDFGGSLTKAIASTDEWNPCTLCMEPEVIQIDEKSIDAYQKQRLGQAQEIDRAWVYYNGCYYAVGYFAKRFAATPGLSELKYQRAIPKSLALIWVAHHRFNLKNRFNVAIACVLPPGERSDADIIEERMRIALSQYQTPSGELKVNLTQFNCKPEGGATYMMVLKNQKKSIQKKTVAIIMIGYRNASILISNRGEVGEFRTSDFGFVQLVDGVIQRTSGQTPDLLGKAIVQAGDEIDPKPLRRLTRSANDADLEIEQLKNAIATSREEYFRKIENWMREYLPRDLDEVILCGGTADYLAPEFKEFFGYTPIQWHGNIKVPDELNPGLNSRLVDVYSLFIYFRSTLGLTLSPANATT